MLTKEDLKQLGIEIPETQEKEYTVYILERCERDKIDRTKYPFHRPERLEDKVYITWDDAVKDAKKMMKKDQTWRYSTKVTSRPKSKLTKKQLEQIKERGW